MEKQYEVIIVGGRIAGASLAIRTRTTKYPGVADRSRHIPKLAKCPKQSTCSSGHDAIT